MRALALTMVLVAACGGMDSNDGDPADGTDDPTDDFSGDSDVTDSSDGDDGPMPTESGYVFIQSYDAMNIPGMPTVGGSASAGFYTDGSACTITEDGPCRLMSCVNATATGPTSAGTITVTGAAQALTLTPGTDHVYTAQQFTMPLFAGGETLTWTASGGDIPAFTASIEAPTRATITSPPEPPSNNPTLVVNRAQPFTVNWTGGGSGRVQVSLFGSAGDRSVTCQFPASDRSGSVPTSALGTLPAGQGSFAMAVVAEKKVVAGEWAVNASAYFNAVWSDLSIVSGPAQFQ